jgi:hypothetical protein
MLLAGRGGGNGERVDVTGVLPRQVLPESVYVGQAGAGANNVVRALREGGHALPRAQALDGAEGRRGGRRGYWLAHPS